MKAIVKKNEIPRQAFANCHDGWSRGMFPCASAGIPMASRP